MQMILNKFYPTLQNQHKSPKNTDSRVSRWVQLVISIWQTDRVLHIRLPVYLLAKYKV